MPLISFTANHVPPLVGNLAIFFLCNSVIELSLKNILIIFISDWNLLFALQYVHFAAFAALELARDNKAIRLVYFPDAHKVFAAT